MFRGNAPEHTAYRLAVFRYVRRLSRSSFQDRMERSSDRQPRIRRHRCGCPQFLPLRPQPLSGPLARGLLAINLEQAMRALKSIGSEQERSY